MGKDIHFYCIDLDYPHEPNKICAKWEYQPEEDDKYCDLLDLLDATAHMDQDNKLELKHKFDIDYNKVWDAFDNKKICPRCAWFFQGGCGTPMILEGHHIQHGNSNPISRSDWFIDKLMVCIGTKAREYDSGHGCRDRLREDVIDSIKQQLEDLGTPIRTSDKEAYEESIRAVSWLEQCFEKYQSKNIDVLYFGDC